MNKYIITLVILLIGISSASASTFQSNGLKTIEVGGDGSVKLDNSDVAITISNPEITVGKGSETMPTESTDTFTISGGNIPISVVDNAINYNNVLTLDTQALKWIDEFGNIETEFSYNPAQKDSLDNTVTKYDVWEAGVNVRLSYYNNKVKQDTFLVNLDKGLTENSRLVETSMLTTNEPITTDAGEWVDGTSVNEIYIGSYVLARPYIYDDGTESVSYGFYHIYSVDGQKYIDVVSDIYGNWSSYVNPVLDPTVATYAYQYKNSGTLNNPNTVYANTCYLNTDTSRECWVIHNISVSNFPTYTNVIDAYYTFTVSNYFAAGYGAFYAIDTAWNHSTVTYNTRPTRGVVLNSSVYFNSATTFNVTGVGIKELVTSWINGTKTNNGIEVIKTGAGSPNIVFGAITLVITYDSTALPTPPSYGAISNTTTLGNTDLANVINNTYYDDALYQNWTIVGQNQELVYTFNSVLDSTWRGFNISLNHKTSDMDENYNLSAYNYDTSAWVYVMSVENTTEATVASFNSPTLFTDHSPYRNMTDGNMSLKFSIENPDNDSEDVLYIDKLNIILTQAPDTPVLTNGTTYACGNDACVRLNDTNISGATYYWQYKLNTSSVWIDLQNSDGTNSTVWNVTLYNYYDFRSYVLGSNGVYSNVSNTITVFMTAQENQYSVIIGIVNSILSYISSTLVNYIIDVDNEVDALTINVNNMNTTINSMNVNITTMNNTINSKLDAIIIAQNTHSGIDIVIS